MWACFGSARAVSRCPMTLQFVVGEMSQHMGGLTPSSVRIATVFEASQSTFGPVGV